MAPYAGLCVGSMHMHDSGQNHSSTYLWNIIVAVAITNFWTASPTLNFIQWKKAQTLTAQDHSFGRISPKTIMACEGWLQTWNTTLCLLYLAFWKSILDSFRQTVCLVVLKITPHIVITIRITFFSFPYHPTTFMISLLHLQVGLCNYVSHFVKDYIVPAKHA